MDIHSICRNCAALVFKVLPYLDEILRGLRRKNRLTAEAVKFIAVYSYLIVYRPDRSPCRVFRFSMAGVM
jgi:hypothetical protein